MHGKRRGWNRRDCTWKNTGFDAVDLSEEGNAFGIYYQQWGRKEEFVSGTLADGPTLHHPRWFKVGDKCAIKVGEQVEISKELTGDLIATVDAQGNPTVLPKYIIK